MSLISELKRRKVFKVAAAYAVAGWLVIEIASTVLPLYETPAWFLRAFVLIVTLGFPVALVMAWVFDMTPEGVKVDTSSNGSKPMFAIAAALAALALGWHLHERPIVTAAPATNAPAVQAKPTAPATPAVDSRSIAVLPFANMSGNPDQDYFSDGMTEELLNVLAKYPQLKVVARTSVFQFKNKGGDVRDIGAKLGVAHILEGSVRRDGNEVRVTAQLVRVSDGFHVWSETYDRKLEGVFALQDEIAQRVGAQLVSSLVGAAPSEARGNIDPVAYDEYLKGRALHRARVRAATAISHFQNAVARQPDFAAAWASLSLSYEVSYYQLDGIARLALGNRLEHMRDAANHAAALAPDAAPTLHALANVARGEGRFLEAEKLYEQSIAADPGYADVREDYSEFLTDMGRFDDALKAARELVTREPSVSIFWFRIANIGIDTDQKNLVDEAVKHLQELDPNGQMGLTSSFILDVNNGRIDAARAEINALRASHSERMAVTWVLFQWALHDPAISDAVVRRAILDGQLDQTEMVALRGDADLFFAALASPDNADKGFYNYENLQKPIAHKLMADPRAKQLLRDSGFEKYWRVKGWPKYCRAKGDNDFECGDFVAKANQ